MPQKYKAILRTYNSRADFAGNCYFYFEYEDTATGKTVSATICANNTSWVPREMGFQDGEYYHTTHELKIRDFNREVKNLPHAGCTHQEIAAFIKKKLAE